MKEEITRSAEWVHSPAGERNHHREVDAETDGDARKPSDDDSGADDLLPRLDSSGAGILPLTARKKLIQTLSSLPQPH